MPPILESLYQSIPFQAVTNLTKYFSSLYELFKSYVYGYSPLQDNIKNTHSWAKANGRELSSQQRMDKMQKNLKKSIEEHKLENKNPEVFATLENHSTEELAITPLTLEKTIISEKTNFRPTMEDAHFTQYILQGLLLGVFDGHGGKNVSSYAAKIFPLTFQEALKKTNNAHHAFEIVFNKIQTDLFNDQSIGLSEGTTALVCFLDNQNNNLFTATLGDSEANLYRKYGNKIQCIPLSPIRTFKSSKDEQRVHAIYDAYEAARQAPCPPRFQENQKSKSRRFSGINVSRALGDIDSSLAYSPLWHSLLSFFKPLRAPFLSLVKEMGIIHKPKITIHKMMPNDLLLLGCDGLFDFLEEKARIDIVSKNNDLEDIVSQMFYKALRQMKHKNNGDNVTIIALKALGNRSLES